MLDLFFVIDLNNLGFFEIINLRERKQKKIDCNVVIFLEQNKKNTLVTEGCPSFKQIYSHIWPFSWHRLYSFIPQ